jgi:hypothetical protein
MAKWISNLFSTGNNHSDIITPELIDALNKSDEQEMEQLWIRFNAAAGNKDMQRAIILEQVNADKGYKYTDILVDACDDIMSSNNLAFSSQYRRPKTINTGPSTINYIIIKHNK